MASILFPELLGCCDLSTILAKVDGEMWVSEWHFDCFFHARGTSNRWHPPFQRICRWICSGCRLRSLYAKAHIPATFLRGCVNSFDMFWPVSWLWRVKLYQRPGLRMELWPPKQSPKKGRSSDPSRFVDSSMIIDVHAPKVHGRAGIVFHRVSQQERRYWFSHVFSKGPRFCRHFYLMYVMMVVRCFWVGVRQRSRGPSSLLQSCPWTHRLRLGDWPCAI